MPMTRELKKRLMGIEDRLEKVEKKRPVQQTNGEEIEDEGVEARLEQIEMVLQIPGETVGDVQVLSAWRYQVEDILKKLEDRFLKVELRGSWTPAEAKDLEGRVKVLQKAVEEIQSTPDPPTLEFDDRLQKLEGKKIPTRDWMKGIEERVHTLEQVPRGQPVIDWIKNTDDRIDELERKPVAGSLSNIMQEVTLDIEGNTRETKALRSLVLKAIWIVSAILAIMTLAQFLTNVLP